MRTLDQIYWDCECTAMCGCKTLEQELKTHPKLAWWRDGASSLSPDDQSRCINNSDRESGHWRKRTASLRQCQKGAPRLAENGDEYGEKQIKGNLQQCQSIPSLH